MKLINYAFTRLLVGRLLSNLGDSIYSLTAMWLVAQTTHDPVWVGIVSATTLLPTLFSFVFGDRIDRSDKRRLLIGLELGQSIAILGLALCYLLGLRHPSIMCLWLFSASLCGNNIYTVQDSYMPTIVSRQALERAQSYMSMTYKLADYMMNMLVGWLLMVTKPLYLFVSSAMLFLGAAMQFKQLPKQAQIRQRQDRPIELFSGFRLILDTPLLLSMTLGGILVNIGFSGFNIYLVVMADQNHSAMLLGTSYAIMAFFGMMGSFVIAHKRLSVYQTGPKWLVMQVGMAVSLLLATCLTSNRYFLIALALFACFSGASQSLYNPIIQKAIGSEDLGKFFSASYAITVGAMLLGSLIFGVVSQFLPFSVFLIGFSACFLVTFLINKNPVQALE